jgi:hypothetical protein
VGLRIGLDTEARRKSCAFIIIIIIKINNCIIIKIDNSIIIVVVFSKHNHADEHSVAFSMIRSVKSEALHHK